MTAIPITSLTTVRLRLEPPDPAFAERTLDYYRRNRDFLAPWNPRLDEDFFTLDYQRSKLEWEHTMWLQDRQYRFYLFRKADGPEAPLIGDLAFSNVIRGAFLSCHLGYKLDAQALNQGYISEALERAIRFAFAELHLHRIEANIMPHNAPSRRVAKKLGFIEEGLARKYLKINGIWQDHIHYVLFNPAEE